MLFDEFASFCEKLDKTSSRLKITEILSELLTKSDKDSIDKVVYLVLGQLAPAYKNIVFNLAEKLMLESVADAYNISSEEVVRDYKKIGDIGEVVYILAQKSGRYKYSSESVLKIYDQLLTIARDDGAGSVERKIKTTAKLLENSKPVSAKFLSRIILGKLRLGFSDKTVIDALSWMETGDKRKKSDIQKAYEVVPDVGLLAKKIKENGIAVACHNLAPEVGVPVLPMLAQRIKSPREMIEKMGKVAVEPKFDGLRVLIHYDKGKLIKAFTRNLNDVTQMFPELKDIGKYLSAKNVILDSEACGMDPARIRLVNFQTTMQRRRKYDIAAKVKSIPVVFQIFDVLYWNNTNLMNKSYIERRKTLNRIVKKNEMFAVDKYLTTKDPDEINRLYRRYISQGLEGVIVKKLDAGYIPGRTGWRWVKMKQEESSVGKLVDTVDGVVMGFTLGKGKRTEFGLGQFLVGVTSGENIVTLTKVGTGLTDKEFRVFKEKLNEKKLTRMPKNYQVHKNYTPDFWVAPEFVVELAGDDLTKSPTHTSGYALRFPRLVGFRKDKSVDQATTIGEVKKMFEMQK